MNYKGFFAKGAVMIAAVTLLASMAFGGTINLAVDSQPVPVGSPFNLNVVLDLEAGEEVNTALVTVQYDPAMVETPQASDIMPDKSAWPSDIVPVSPAVDEANNQVKFSVGTTFGGAGQTGAGVPVGTIAFTPKAEGDAAFSFVQDADLSKGTHAIDQNTFTDVLTGFNDLTVTFGGGGGLRWDFDADAEGWTLQDDFSGAPITITGATGDASGGYLNLESATNDNTFGFWYSPMTAIDPLEADMLYRAQFNVIGSLADKSMLPSFRCRFNASNQGQGDMIRINSKDAGEASPDDTTAMTYDLYFEPQLDALETGVTGGLAFDLVNFSTTDADAATVSLDWVEVTKADATALTWTSVANYTFDADQEGWTFFSVPAAFDSPESYWDADGALAMASVSNNCFGSAISPAGAVAMQNDTLIGVKVIAGAMEAGAADKAPSDMPLMRIRLSDEPNNQVNYMHQAPVWDRFTEVKQYNTDEYMCYFVNQGGIGPNLGIAIDLVNLDEDSPADSVLIIDSVEIMTATLPTFE